MFEENEYTPVQRLRSSNFFKNNYLQFKSWSSDINYSSFQPTAMQWSTVLWEFRAIKDCSFWGHRYASKHYKQRDMLWYLDFSNTCSSPNIPRISVFRVPILFLDRKKGVYHSQSVFVVSSANTGMSLSENESKISEEPLSRVSVKFGAQYTSIISDCCGSQVGATVKILQCYIRSIWYLYTINKIKSVISCKNVHGPQLS